LKPLKGIRLSQHHTSSQIHIQLAQMMIVKIDCNKFEAVSSLVAGRWSLVAKQSTSDK